MFVTVFIAENGLEVNDLYDPGHFNAFFSIGQVLNPIAAPEFASNHQIWFEGQASNTLHLSQATHAAEILTDGDVTDLTITGETLTLDGGWFGRSITPTPVVNVYSNLALGLINPLGTFNISFTIQQSQDVTVYGQLVEFTGIHILGSLTLAGGGLGYMQLGADDAELEIQGAHIGPILVSASAQNTVIKISDTGSLEDIDNPLLTRAVITSAGGSVTIENTFGLSGVTPRGTIEGDIMLAGGDDTLIANGAIIGDVDMGDGDNDVQLGFSLQGALNFGSGTDSFINTTGIAQGNINMGSGADDFENQRLLTGDIDLGDGADTGTNAGEITGNIDLGDGANSFTNEATALGVTNPGTITGNVTGGVDGDIVTNSGEITGQIALGDGADFYFGSGATAAATVHGEDGHDNLTGSGFDDVLDGGAGNDVLAGGGGQDRLINGGGTANILTGGDDEDVFVFDVASSGGTITDFQHGLDTIAFEGLWSDQYLVRIFVDGDLAFASSGMRANGNRDTLALNATQVGDDVQITVLTDATSFALRSAISPDLNILLEDTLTSEIDGSDFSF